MASIAVIPEGQRLDHADIINNFMNIKRVEEFGGSEPTSRLHDFESRSISPEGSDIPGKLDKSLINNELTLVTC